MSTPIEFWFDFTSPYAYLAAEKIDELAARYGRTVNWHPILLGVIFKETGTVPLVDSPLKGDYSRRDFPRSARFLGLPFSFPSGRFPLATQSAARAFYWLSDQQALPTSGLGPNSAHDFARAVFRALFVHDQDISDIAVLVAVAQKLGINGDQLTQAIGTPEIKERLKQETATAAKKGVFGAPFIIIDNEPFWGADRLPQIERWLETGGF